MNQPGSPDVVSSHVTARDGTRIGYNLYGGKENAVRVVLLHSLAMDRHFWTPVVERLMPRASVLAIDARGHGASDKPAGPYTVSLFAQDVYDVVRATDFRNVLIAGASMGGCVALEFAATFPDAIAAGLIDTTAWYGETAPQDWNARAEKAEAGGLAPLVEFQTTRWFSDAFRAEHPDVVQRCVDTFLRNEVAPFAATGRMLGSFDGRALMRQVKVPSCVIVGEEDYAATPAMARALHEGIAASTFVEIPKARHLTPLETPDIVARELHALLDRAGCAR
ncbi:alpha/beta fold hydrolase [Paraburkholderia diazotrophica]|uniref:3-oxoadipate enol-lactonase/3-oxoadipate enol-lactonase / 4-carboxymuconolactone decarboxylase n=1 Tax=Paraburkholderia diazotrophica TaxID=667676 RepID=A0A1H7CH18_9BURK|nr:alpha/beta fold hydrolase [Paraburkholderia diazotrophica]SEJ84975.1 3-oxoadipate enol-lactonase/3-oxoadipate enol-lactonase / 4-carboxymuconolactone decarboxylase [Paraburkholderia diazotrophica]